MKRKDFLTPKERQVLDLVFLGMTNREIALELVISESTVESHLVHIYRKLGVSNRTEAILPLLDELLTDATEAVLKFEGFLIEDDDDGDHHNGHGDDHDNEDI